MGRSYKTEDARKIIARHKKVLKNLSAMLSLEDSYKKDIKESADSFVAREIMQILRGVPVEELNRNKHGIRIKPLRDHGFDTMADIFTASRYSIVAVKGISADSSYTIKAIASDFAEKSRREVKIKLSTDNKDRYSSDLVLKIAIYKNSLRYIEETKAFLSINQNTVNDLIKELKPSTNGLRWLFSSKAKKELANEAFSKLVDLENSEYGNTAEQIIDNLNRTNKTSIEEAWDDFSKNSVSFYNILEKTNPGLLGTSDSIYGLPEDLARAIQDECFFPDGLLCTLRRYQEWGVKYILHQEKVLLGDEMGLGKTIQAIATMVSLKNIGATHFVVVCPASVLTNWCREITKHSRLRAIKIHGSSRNGTLNSWIKTGGVAVTTYETTAHFNLDPSFKFSLLVVDEAHYIKNFDARRSQNTINISTHAERLLFMTGTALENNVDEMINLIQILQPQVASSIKSVAFMSSAEQFRIKVAPAYYRRKRTDVLTELPDKVETNEWCTLNPAEERVYEDAVLAKNYVESRRVSWNIDDLSKSSKAIRMKEIIDEATSEGRKVLVFSFFLDTISKIHNFLGSRCLNPINGSVNIRRRQEIIDEFDKAPAGTVLLAQIQSGGTGLNIQSASVVILCEPQFKPSIENQAISRAYRMGQSRDVFVYRLLCEKTVDEKLIETLEAKQTIFNAFADKSVAAQESIQVDEKAFGEIINEEIERIKKKRAMATEVDAKSEIQSENLSYESNVSQSTPPTIANSNKDNKAYYERIMKMTYSELVDSLLKKYGPARYDYYTDERCKTKNKFVTRTKEGLFCHHIDEDKAIWLSNDKFAVQNPFKYQKADRLVYCNLLEHFLLHILIAEEPKSIEANQNEIQGIGGAITFICKQLNDLYNGYEYKNESNKIMASLLENDYESYIIMLKRLYNLRKRDPLYSSMITKKRLSMGWDGNVYDKIYQELD